MVTHKGEEYSFKNVGRIKKIKRKQIQFRPTSSTKIKVNNYRKNLHSHSHFLEMCFTERKPQV